MMYKHCLLWFDFEENNNVICLIVVTTLVLTGRSPLAYPPPVLAQLTVR